jgi:ubiquinol-cytochrome c reductase cytochrome c subunit
MQLSLALLVALNTASAQESVERGRTAFMQMGCYACHGTMGQGGERGAGPKLAPNPFPYEAFAFQTRRPRANMPRYPQEYLSDAQLADIYSYISSIKPGPAAKDIPLLRAD